MKGEALLIDDGELDLKVMSAALRRQGYECQAFQDWKEGLAWAAKGKPKLILLDIQLPGTTGYELIATLRKAMGANLAPIIMVSGLNQLEDVRKAVSAGASDYVVKPLDPMVLLEKVRRFEAASSGEFASVPVQDPAMRAAAINRPMEILELSEFGAAIRMPFRPALGETLELANLASELFGVAKVLARCLSADSADRPGFFNAKVTFVGLTEAQRQLVRKACRKLWAQAKGGEL